MAIGDLSKKILYKVTAETAEAARNMGGFFKGITDGVNAGVDKLGKLNQAFEGIAKIATFAQDAIKGWGEDLRLEATNAGIAIGRLSDAFKGLVDDDALNQFAAKSANGALKLTQQQMETVGQAAVALRDKGFDLTKSLEALTDAAVTGRTKGLRALGIEVEEGQSKFQTATNLMKELNKTIADSHGPVSQAADDVDRLAVAWANAKDEAMNFAAEAIIATSEAVNFELMRKHVQEQNLRNPNFDVFSALGGEKQFGTNFLSSTFGGFDRGRAAVLAQQNQAANMSAFAGGLQSGRDQIRELQTIEMPDDNVGRKPGELAKMRAAAEVRAAQAILRNATMEVERAFGRSGFTTSEGHAVRSAGGPNLSLGQAAGVGNFDFGAAIRGIETKRTGDLTADWMARSEQFGTPQKNALEAAFGPIEQFDAYQQSFEALGGTFSAFSEAVSAGYEAIVTGQGSVTEAFRRIMADGQMALGKSSVVRALSETALGFGSLALGPIGGVSASAHFKSAALHGAVAVAAGVAANALGTSAQGAASAAAPSASAPGNSATGSSNTNAAPSDSRPIIVVLGEHYGDESARMRQLDVQRKVDRAIRERDR